MVSGEALPRWGARPIFGVSSRNRVMATMSGLAKYSQIRHTENTLPRGERKLGYVVLLQPMRCNFQDLYEGWIMSRGLDAIARSKLRIVLSISPRKQPSDASNRRKEAAN